MYFDNPTPEYLLLQNTRLLLHLPSLSHRGEEEKNRIYFYIPYLTRYPLILPPIHQSSLPPPAILPPISRALYKKRQDGQQENQHGRHRRHNHDARTIRIRTGQIRTRAIEANDPAVRDAQTVEIDIEGIVRRRGLGLKGSKEVCVFKRRVRDAELGGGGAEGGGVGVGGCGSGYVPVVGFAWVVAGDAVGFAAVYYAPAAGVGRLHHDDAAVVVGVWISVRGIEGLAWGECPECRVYICGVGEGVLVCRRVCEGLVEERAYAAGGEIGNGGEGGCEVWVCGNGERWCGSESE